MRSAVSASASVNVIGQDAHVLHDVFRPGEDPLVDLLENDTFFGESGAEDGQIRVVYVAFSRVLDRDQASGDIKLGRNQGGFQWRSAPFFRATQLLEGRIVAMPRFHRPAIFHSPHA